MYNKTVKTNYTVIDNDPINASKGARIEFSYNLTKHFLKKENKILDIGCGIGVFIIKFDEKVNIYGVELDYNALIVANNYCNNAIIVNSSALDLPFKDDTFDIVTMWEVIEHVPFGTEDKLLQEIKRILKNNGYLLLSTPYDNIFSKLMDPAYLLRGHRHYSENKLSTMLNKRGFKIETCITCGGFNSLIATNLFYINKHLFKRKDGKLQKFFERRSKHEYNKKGFATLFICARNIK